MSTFDAGPEEFAKLVPIMWNPLGERLVAASAPAAGERVLDVCCGAGASALPAARRVGPDGLVDAVDLSMRLIELGHAASGDVPWLRFVHADATEWTSAQPYDVVQSGYGVIFLPDLDADSHRLVELLRPGGRFAVMTWRQGAITGFGSCVAKAVASVRGEPPSPPSAMSSADRINTADTLSAWLTSLGLTSVRVTPFDFEVPLDVDVAWAVVAGTGMRAMIAGLAPAEISLVRSRLPSEMEAASVTHLDAASLVGVGIRA